MVKRKQDTILRVDSESSILEFLLRKMGGMTQTSIKQLLLSHRVSVNRAIVTRGDTTLQIGQTVTITSGKGNISLHHPKLKMVFEDDSLLVVEKQPGLLTVPTFPGSQETTAFSILKAYVKRQDPHAGIYVVHRLDRETSGLLVFAKTPELQHYMRMYWRQLVTRRTYVAIIEGIPDKTEGTITSWFTEDKRNAMVYSSPVDDGGQKAVTHYHVLKSSEPSDDNKMVYSLVELNLETGRTNQIRVHMQSIGHPVAGDRKYGHGNEFTPIDRLCLHARVLEFIHPVTEQTVHFETPTPRDFLRVVHKSRD